MARSRKWTCKYTNKIYIPFRLHSANTRSFKLFIRLFQPRPQWGNLIKQICPWMPVHSHYIAECSEIVFHPKAQKGYLQESTRRTSDSSRARVCVSLSNLLLICACSFLPLARCESNSARVCWRASSLLACYSQTKLQKYHLSELLYYYFPSEFCDNGIKMTFLQS